METNIKLNNKGFLLNIEDTPKLGYQFSSYYYEVMVDNEGLEKYLLMVERKFKAIILHNDNKETFISKIELIIREIKYFLEIEKPIEMKFRDFLECEDGISTGYIYRNNYKVGEREPEMRIADCKNILYFYKDIEEDIMILNNLVNVLEDMLTKL